jgi:hypothetical protein
VKNQKRLKNNDADNQASEGFKQSPSDHAIDAVAKIELKAYAERSRMDQRFVAR